MAERVKIVEVGPRDGLQNEKQPIDVATKVALIERLVAAGVTHIEAASFVSPKWVPQMAGSAQVMAAVPRAHQAKGVHYSALTPNLQGLEAALAAGCEEVAVFGAASESFSRKNINCSIAESLERFRSVTEAAQAAGVRVRGYVSCVLGCPYEGAVAPAQVLRVALQLREMGCHEISLGDTIGRGTPDATRRLLEACLRELPATMLAGHYHDTWGMAVANVAASLEMGLRTFDSSVAGLGGCPYAAGASGNVASEDVVYLLQNMGYETGIDLDALVDAGLFISQALGRAPQSRVSQALRSACVS
ncbi:hydroxymethylglutaryl-CoA lyase [Xenophilus arseniciresistens]|uniref:hydroxymethylglutaryl-CoA lyase n=1 Tax=Xenophilus arseniciresistens TaxID=1283306 RepID=A0AAE3SXP3_9BURK|nr:hydroxymethylglutaryl-CoA lyase [Xenophilus arseniciresistens]MDA7415159.1 hydroxymethylglutaryl-CoA lyase [Xenophilus arseniciresistens]